jgi:hypothetical protein
VSLDFSLYDTGRCSHCESKIGERRLVFDTNITHNLTRMAVAAGVYNTIWRPDDVGYTTARQIVSPLGPAIEDMKRRPDYYRQFDAENKWGTYDQFVPWLERLIEACEANPDAEVEVSR